MKRKISSVLISLVAMGTMTITTPAMPIIATQQGSGMYEMTTIEPRTDIKEWRYKVIDGNLYKRLYNYTRNRWEGDWIFVASGVEEL